MSIPFICKDSYSKSGTFCITEEDFFLIILNIIAFSVIITFIYRNYFLSEKQDTLTYTANNPFTILGEGALSKYYQPVSVQQKPANTKKKMMKNNHNNSQINEKANGVNEIRCNSCGNSVKVSYQYTLYKLI